MPFWLNVISIFFILFGIASAIIIAIDVKTHPQPMGIMNLVWPITALFGTGLILWFYFAHGRTSSSMQHSGHEGHHAHQGHEHHAHHDVPFPIAVAKGACHCGAGCTLGDIICETLAALFPVIALWFGYQTIFADKIFAVWILDFIVAFGFGVVFQYFSIAPMRGLGVKDGIIAAVKADTLSLIAWQLGMYGFMAIAHFWLFGSLLGTKLEANMPAFWFMMQIAMLCGFVTSFPMNWFLIKKGIKEAM